MSRSVSYMNNAKTVIFFTADWLNSEFTSQDDYGDFENNLVSLIQKKLKSYKYTDMKYDNRETKIILENELCSIGLSEYCGVWSLSVAPAEEDYYLEYNREAFAKHHAGQIKETLEKCLKDVGAKVLNKVGTFSNGEAVFEYKNKEK